MSGPVRLRRVSRFQKADIVGWSFAVACRLCAWTSVVVLAVLLICIIRQAWGWLDWQFLTSFNSRRPEAAGVLSGLVGSLWLIGLTSIIAAPIGIGAAIYLEEYAPANFTTRFIQLNISNLAGVPSIVYGLLGYTVFVRFFDTFQNKISIEVGQAVLTFPFGPSLLSGALTLSLLSLPVIIIASQESLRAIPATIRHASLALGATKWQTTTHQVLPAAIPGIVTGTILALSRAIGETAPLVVLGAALHYSRVPGDITGPTDAWNGPTKVVGALFEPFCALPLQIFDFTSRANDEFQHVAAAAIIVLLCALLSLNTGAILLRQYYRQKIKW